MNPNWDTSGAFWIIYPKTSGPTPPEPPINDDYAFDDNTNYQFSDSSKYEFTE
jgi:hypothetical protein